MLNERFEDKIYCIYTYAHAALLCAVCPPIVHTFTHTWEFFFLINFISVSIYNFDPFCNITMNCRVQ